MLNRSSKEMNLSDTKSPRLQFKNNKKNKQMNYGVKILLSDTLRDQWLRIYFLITEAQDLLNITTEKMISSQIPLFIVKSKTSSKKLSRPQQSNYQEFIIQIISLKITIKNCLIFLISSKKQSARQTLRKSQKQLGCYKISCYIRKISIRSGKSLKILLNHKYITTLLMN